MRARLVIIQDADIRISFYMIVDERGLKVVSSLSSEVGSSCEKMCKLKSEPLPEPLALMISFLREY